MHDVFISYATEDNNFASDIAYGLKNNGFNVWFAPLSLKVGEKLLDSIEKGLNESRTGVLVLSRNYLSKNWTSYEMDILVRQNIEGKKLLPIWLDVSKEDIERKHIGLSGIVGITETSNISIVVSQLVGVLSEWAPYRGIIPIWENPVHRFLQGIGEVNLQSSNGPATTIYELLIHARDDEFPFWLAGKSYAKTELLYHVAQIIGLDPPRVKNWISENDYHKLWDMCIKNNLNPDDFY